MVCKGCGDYAAASGNTEGLCGNCAILTPEQLNTVIASREEKAKIAAGETNPGQLIAELRQENAQLKADNAMLKEQLAAAKKLPDPAKVEPPKPTWPKQDVPNRSKPGHDDK